MRGLGDDVWAWEPEGHGLYTVRSLCDEQCRQLEEHRASSSGNITWTRIWKLSVPPKVRVFWWRVVNGFLPTRGVLHRRHVEPILLSPDRRRPSPEMRKMAGELKRERKQALNWNTHANTVVLVLPKRDNFF